MAMSRLVALLGVLACGTALASCDVSDAESDRPRAKTHTVRMEGMVFRPNVITVTTGDTIVWINKDLVPHTATSSQAAFDSKIVNANQSWRYTAHQPGDFEYICSLHPTMAAQLQVR